MTDHRISKHDLKMAWKMLDTIFEQYEIPAKHQERLLQGAALLSLEDLKDAGFLRWKSPPAEGMALAIRRPRAVGLVKQPDNPFALRQDYSEREAEEAYEEVERLLDRYGVPEPERASLFTALPCVALAALQRHVEWKKPPPFMGRE